MDMETICVEKVKDIKRTLLTIAKTANVGHIPSSFSSVEILYVLYDRIANINKSNAKELDRDRVIISKEHARLGQVAVLS